MTKQTKLVLAILTALILGGISYFVLPPACLFYYMFSQMRAGQRYMDSITENDVPVWIERTEKYLSEYDPNSNSVGVYGIGDKPVPAHLKKLKILRIDISRDAVYYVWVGGLDHTYLEVQKAEQGDFKFIANYNDYSSKVIWPKEEVNQPIENAVAEPCTP